MALLRHIAIRARNMEASRRFYETLGLKYIDHGPSRKGIDLTDGTLNMTIIQYEGEERQPLEEGTEFVHFGLIVDNLERLYITLQENGEPLLRDDVKSRNEIDMRAPPTRSFKVADPDGNVIDITCAKDEWRGATS